MSPLSLLPFFLLLTLPYPSQSCSLPKFKSCLPSNIPLSIPSNSTYANLVSLNFRNNRANPAAIVLARTEFQVAAAVRCAREAGFQVCARSGGHSLVGKSLCTGVLIDLGNIRHVRVLAGAQAEIGGGANLGEVLWRLWHGGRRWFASGLCPGVGVGGYVFGGGHGPYEGLLGMACDALVSVKMVDRFGNMVVASRKTRKNLFWALCGAGGGQFGVVTSFRIRTASSRVYDRAVVFRFNWPHDRIGELMHRWMNYGEMGGKIWFRMEMYLGNSEGGMTGYGACYDVGSVAECMRRLKRARFFNTAGRTTKFISRVNNALDLHAFFGPDGNWGRKRAANVRKALLEKRYIDRGQANGRTYQSTFMKKGKRNNAPSAAFWQKYADFCRDAGGRSLPWIVCELNLFNNAIDKPQNNAFAHRRADIITHYIVGGGSAEDKRFVYRWMKQHLRPFTIGVYVNYPELELGKKYAKLYWGESLPRLRNIKSQYDPKLFFANPQPIPTH